MPKHKDKKKGRGVLNTLINKLPFELHLPGYQYCGPGTKLEKRLRRGDKGINPLDEACRDHDIEYSRSSDLHHRHQADLQLAKKAWQRVRAPDAGISERSAALAVAGLMKAKVKMGGKLNNRKTKNIAKLRAALKRVLAKKNNLKKRKRILKSPKKRGGVLPAIPLLLAGLSALGGLAGGGAQIAKAVKSAEADKKNLNENIRHNRTMEAIALGKRGTGILPFNQKKIDNIVKQENRGKGLYLKPYAGGKGIRLKKKL